MHDDHWSMGVDMRHGGTAGVSELLPLCGSQDENPGIRFADRWLSLSAISAAL